MVLGLAYAASPWGRVEVALLAGMVLAMMNLTAFAGAARRYSRLLIQCSIVLLGFWIDLHDVLKAGLNGLGFSAGVIVLTFALGAALRRVLGVDEKVTALLSSGTAICGGSAIAATGAVIRASDAQMSVALGLVFILNAAAVFAFPPLGHALGLSQAQFGAWAAVAVHDVANVVATASRFGEDAAADATVIKLTRVLWLAPICLALGWWFAHRDPEQPGGATSARPSRAARVARVLNLVPWFIIGFVAASGLRTALVTMWPDARWAVYAGEARAAAKVLMTAALFLIGCGLSRTAIAGVGVRPMLLGVLLWVIVSACALLVIVNTVG